jgi:hypothetical protein
MSIKTISASSKAWVCGCYVAGIESSNPAKGIDVRLFVVVVVVVVCCLARGFRDELITRSEESYRVCVSVTTLDLETSRRPRHELRPRATQTKRYYKQQSHNAPCSQFPVR